MVLAEQINFQSNRERHAWLSACHRKVRHPNFLTAIIHASQLKQRFDLSTYVCTFCGCIHVGNSAYLRKIKLKIENLERRLATCGRLDLYKQIDTLKKEHFEIYDPDELEQI